MGPGPRRSPHWTHGHNAPRRTTARRSTLLCRTARSHRQRPQQLAPNKHAPRCNCTSTARRRIVPGQDLDEGRVCYQACDATQNPVGHQRSDHACRVRFPCGRRSICTKDTIRTGAARGQRPRNLLVEGSIVPWAVAAAMLRARCRDVDIIENGNEALDTVERKQYVADPDGLQDAGDRRLGGAPGAAPERTCRKSTCAASRSPAGTRRRRTRTLPPRPVGRLFPRRARTRGGASPTTLQQHTHQARQPHSASPTLRQPVRGPAAARSHPRSLRQPHERPTSRRGPRGPARASAGTVDPRDARVKGDAAANLACGSSPRSRRISSASGGRQDLSRPRRTMGANGSAGRPRGAASRGARPRFPTSRSPFDDAMSIIAPSSPSLTNQQHTAMRVCTASHGRLISGVIAARRLAVRRRDRRYHVPSSPRRRRASRRRGSSSRGAR